MDTINRKMSEMQLTVHCKRCDRDSKHRIGAILAHKKFVCPACSSLNDVDTVALETKISSAQRKHDSQKADAPAQS
jgi:transposase-like protein